MAKEFVKGVTVGEATAEENTQPAVSTVETNEEETKQVIRANEEDFIAGLIAAADFASDEEETQRIEIVRNGKLAFAFSIRPLGSEEYDKCRKKFTKYVRNKQLGIKMPEDTDRIKYQSAIIHKATIAEDREKLWDNKKVWQALIAWTCDIAASKSLYVSIVSFRPILTPRTAPTWKIGFFNRFMIPRTGEVMRSIARIVTLHVFPAKLLSPLPSVESTGLIRSFASSRTSYFSFAQLARLFSVF